MRVKNGKEKTNFINVKTTTRDLRYSRDIYLKPFSKLKNKNKKQV